MWSWLPCDGGWRSWVLGVGRAGPRSWPNWPKELAGLAELNGEGGGGRGRMNYETRGTGIPKRAYKPIHIFPMRLPELSQQTGTELGLSLETLALGLGNRLTDRCFTPGPTGQDWPTDYLGHKLTDRFTDWSLVELTVRTGRTGRIEWGRRQ